MKYLRNEREAIMYLTDCTLATVSSMAIKKTRVKSEYQRQIEIAQKGVDFIKSVYGEDTAPPPTVSNRIVTIITKYDGSVNSWASAMQYKYNDLNI